MSYRKWTPEDLEFIKNNAGNICDDEIAAKLSAITNSNITTPMIRRQRRKLNIQKSRGRPKKIVESQNIQHQPTEQVV